MRTVHIVMQPKISDYIGRPKRYLWLQIQKCFKSYMWIKYTVNEHKQAKKPIFLKTADCACYNPKRSRLACGDFFSTISNITVSFNSNYNCFRSDKKWVIEYKELR